MAAWRNWLDWVSPDVGATLRRFWFPALLLALGAAVFVLLVNNWVDDAEEGWTRVLVGIWTGAGLAIGGVLFSERAGAGRVLPPVLGYVVPVAAIALFQWRSTLWYAPHLLPVVAVLWISVAGFLPRGGRTAAEEQDRFWHFNHRAVATGIVAAVAFGIIGLGAIAIERSLSALFGFEIGDLVYRLILPVAGALLVPLYWLGTLPREVEFTPDLLTEPDFLARSAGFLGQFLLVPLLLAYSAILLAYAAQIVALRALPHGMLGWMVLGYTVTGALCWLLLYPAFIRDRMIVRFFRRWWFWLTIIPIVLYAIAVGVRIDAYGLTLERMLLIGGGLWAAILTLVHLVGRGDIRLVPGLAALILLVLAIGPWNASNLPRWQQLQRLEAAVASAYSRGPEPAWTSEDAATARGSLGYLLYDEDAEAALRDLLGARGIDLPDDTGDRYGVYAALKLPIVPTTETTTSRSLRREWQATPVDVTATPYVLGFVNAWSEPQDSAFDLRLAAEPGGLRVWRIADDSVTTMVDLRAWLERQTGEVLAEPFIDFALAGASYRLVLNDLQISVTEQGPALVSVTGLLFSDRPTSQESTP